MTLTIEPGVLMARTTLALDRIAAAYRHEPVVAPPVLIGDITYWITDDDPARVPDDYFEPGGYASMQAFQERKISAHLAAFDDSYIPFLLPWYGTVVVPSAFGCRILFARGAEPAVEGPIITDPAQVARLQPPDPERDGLMPRVLACIDHFRAHSDLPISFTDNQGPLNIALNLVGLERLIYWMIDEPTAVHDLMDLCTTVLIDWVALQKRRAGAPTVGGAFPHMIALPPEFGGVWLSDDDSTILSPELYREFVVPYNARVFRAFGGGTLHYCGNGEHQLENLRATDGLVGVNVWSMGEFAQVFRAQEVLGDGVTVMACDTTPVEIEPYFRDLFAGLRPRGAIVATYPSAVNALRYGKARVETVRRDPAVVGREAWEVISRLLRAQTPS